MDVSRQRGKLVKKSFLAVCAAAFALGGCASAPEVDPKAVQAYLADKPAETHRLFTKVMMEGERNRVLNLLRAGLASMELGHNELAAQSFDEALLTIETMYGGSEEAEQARSVFTAEDRKIFRGEPYERAMAFYYRGILYLMEGDYENARASFRSGILQDTLAEQEQFQQDFALLEFLEGWSSQCNGNGDLAADAFAFAKEHNPSVTIPDAQDNLLVLADFGYAPVKYAEGEYREMLKVKANGKRSILQPDYRLNGATARLRNRESILWQAKTRGGRAFDNILEGKARFKEDMESLSETGEAIRDIGLAAGAAGLASGDEDMAQIGGAAALFGMFTSIASDIAAEATKPEADIRQWDNLPETVLYGASRVDDLQAAPGVSNLSGAVREGGDERCRVAWVRHPATQL